MCPMPPCCARSAARCGFTAGGILHHPQLFEYAYSMGFSSGQGQQIMLAPVFCLKGVDTAEVMYCKQQGRFMNPSLQLDQRLTGPLQQGCRQESGRWRLHRAALPKEAPWASPPCLQKQEVKPQLDCWPSMLAVPCSLGEVHA